MKNKTSVSSMMAAAIFLFTTLATLAQPTLPGHVPEVIPRLHLSPVGRLPGTNELHLVLELPLRHPATLTNFLAQLYDPASTNYHKYLTKEQFTEQFGPTASDYQAVIDFARQHGLHVDAPHRSRLALDVRGQVADIEPAFHVTLHTYQHPTEARTFYAPDGDPKVDAGVPVLQIGGLTDYPEARAMSHAREVTGKAGPASGTGYGGNYQGKDFRNAYIPGSALAGSGQLVGLYEIDGYYPGDIALYEKFAGLTNVPLQNVLIDGFNGTPSLGNNLEVELDIEMVVAMAPALAGVVIFESPNSYADGLDILDSMANNTQISQFSSSIGFTGASPYNYFDQALETLAAQGQSFFMASGDGDAWTQPIWVPAASPYVTAAGGTTLTMTSGGGAYASETVWNSGTTFGSWSENDSSDTGSGGGVSSYYSIPTWQTGLNMATNLGSTTARNIPDVAMVAIDCSIVYNNGVTNSYAYGTSIAAPLWAGFTALINQQATAGNKLPIGLINSAIYPLLEQPAYTNLFHDITTGNNYSASSTANYPATPGYDLCTGLGTPRGTNLINALVANLTSKPTPSITSGPVSETVPVGGTATFTVSASGDSPLGYSWLENAEPISGATNAVVTIGDVQTNISGSQFRCVVANNYGSVTSAIAILSVAVPPTITTEPVSETVLAGGTASFSVAAAGTSPLSYSWMNNATFIPGATNATYSKSSLQLTNSGAQFTCLVSNTAGSVTSQTAILTVVAAPSITSQPASQTVALGGTANFSVTATGTSPLSYSWLENAVLISGATNATFSAANVQTNVSGSQFRCIITNNFGSITSTVATLTVSLPPSITVQPVSETVARGGTASFSLTATGASPLQYSWMRNGASIKGATNAAYSTNNVQLTNSGAQFSCVVSNSAGSVTSVLATLTVAAPPSITTQPASETVAVGGTASFGLTAAGTGPLSYFWKRNTSLITGATTATYSTNNVQATNSGTQFSCVVSNLAGSITSSVAILTVAVPPAITAQPASETVIIGGSASFSVTATGTAPLKYLWLRNSTFIAGATNATYSTNRVAVVNSGTKFSCVVSNAVGSVTSVAATLTVVSNATTTSIIGVTSPSSAPEFTVSLAGTNLIIHGINGVAGGSYALLTSTNLMMPTGQWAPVATNVLNSEGNFTLTATNSFQPAAPVQYYILELQ